MDDQRPRRPLADDDAFLESLSDLDAGLSSKAPERPAASDVQPGEPGTLPRSITATFDALTLPAEAAPNQAEEDAQSPRHRPLLQLFPSDTAARSRASGPRRATPAQPRRLTDRAAASEHDAFYGLKEKAFSEAADPRFFYHSTPHDAVVQQLLTAVRRREGLVLLTGAAGLGKTTVCRVVREQLDRRTLISLLSDRIETPEQLLAQILHDFGVVSRDAHARERAPSSELRKTLRSFLESLGSLDASAVIVVDDAHELPPAVFDEVRALCETAHVSSLLQVVLVGSEKLAARLRHAENRALHQRVAVRSAMQPIPSAEIGDYIAHRLSIAGNARVEFDEAALSRVSAISRGVPLAINRICDRALSLGGASSAGVITESMADAAGRELGLSGARPMLTALLGQLVVALFVAAFLVVGAAVAAWVFRDSVARAITRWESIPAPPDAARRLPPPLAPLRPPEGF